MTEDIHELKVGMINTWLDSLEVGPDVYESEDESPIQQTVPDSSNSEMEGDSHRMRSAATFQRGYGADPDSCILASEEIWQSMSREMDSGVKPKELSHFGGLFDQVKQVIDLYTSELATISDSRSWDSALADAILHHFDNSEENQQRVKILLDVDRVVDQVMNDITMDDCTISEELSVKGDACSSLGSNTCPNLQTVSASEPSEPSDSSSDSSQSSLSSSEMSDSSSSSSDTSTFVSAHLMEGTSSYNGSSVANWAVDNEDYSTDSSIDERTWQEQYQGEGE
ncbi:hypothetical protein IW262DRAFT_1456167 [Armillaria fumosa]|nr:hypothetical protein IW262DRAFT_1456167 [Armillaria fumosa]